MRVLVVDDDEASRYLLASYLPAFGHEVVQAKDGRDALEKARAEPVDVVLTDILMPNMDGFALCREWKADAQLAGAPIILYSSSYTAAADQRLAENIGADGYLVKPQEPAVLVAMIEDAVRASRGVRGTVEPTLPESEVLEEYGKRVAGKLDQKLEELATANEDLRRTLEALSDEVGVKDRLIDELANDIRERERAEEAMRAATETMSTVVAASPVPIVTYDSQGCVRLWNPAAERLFSMTAEDAVGRAYPLVAEGGSDELARMYGPMFRGEVDQTRNVVRRRAADGRWLELAVEAAPLHGDHGQVDGLLAVYQDITEMRRVEMMKTAFGSMISHELRTPLTAILGYAELLEQMDPHDASTRIRQVVGNLRESADRMRHLVENLLEVSQIESGPLKLDLEPIDVSALVASVAAQTALTQKHRLELEVDDGLPTVAGDWDRLQTVLRQLLENAVKYSPDGGDVVVRAAARDGSVAISVRDHGVGIDPVEAGHIFDLFTQADMSDTREFGGVGVGLFLAHRIAEAHKGTLEVESEPGAGSVFTVVLPATRQE